jgi:hypothetical protein
MDGTLTKSGNAGLRNARNIDRREELKVDKVVSKSFGQLLLQLKTFKMELTTLKCSHTLPFEMFLAISNVGTLN